MRVVLDLEADGLQPTKIHCIVCKDLDRGDVYEWEGNEVQRFVGFTRSISLVVGHNLIDYDLPALDRLLGCRFDRDMVCDTLVLSRLLKFKREGGHSLENWGNILKHPKVGLDIKDWSTYSPEMLIRCRNDVELCHKVYSLLSKYNSAWNEAVDTEHRIAWVCREMQENGFGFNIQGAIDLFKEIEGRCQEIDGALQEAFPPILKETQLKTKIKQEWIAFNPSSPKQIVERLAPYWKPKELTEKGQAKISEANLASLSDEAPEACKRLVERLLLSGRQRALKQWIDAYDPQTQRVHPRFLHIGTWTHRLGHREPNLANVAAPKSIKYKGEALSQMATALGGRMRGLWQAAPGTHLVGCDAEGIQLRIFGHYIEDQTFIEALVNGNSKLGTDPHSINGRILGVLRDPAKTFIYAFLLGAGDAKLGEILGRGPKEGGKAKSDFVSAYPGLAKLKQEVIPQDAKRGFFKGFDGRLIDCPSEHLMLAGYLQAGEAVIMKKGCLLWKKEISKLGIPYKLVTWPHDEWQTEVHGGQAAAEAVGRLQADSIHLAGKYYGLKCPMAGKFVIGNNWLSTH